MKEIINFLKTIKSKTSQIISPEVPYNVYFVMGNTSCDMDSFLSSIVYSYFKNVQSGIISHDKHESVEEISYNLYDIANYVYVPIINCPKKELFNRLDIAELCLKSGLGIDDFFYYQDDFTFENDKLIFKPLIYSSELLNGKYFNYSY